MDVVESAVELIEPFDRSWVSVDVVADASAGVRLCDVANADSYNCLWKSRSAL